MSLSNGNTAFPPPPANFDWSALTVVNSPTVNGHVECRYSASKKAWTQPEFVRDPYIRVHGLAPGLNYGQQVYEGLKAFRTPGNKIHIFRPEAHAARMRHSARMVCLPEVPDRVFLECARAAVAGNAEFVPPPTTEGFMYLRPLLFGAGPQVALAPPDEFVFAVYAVPGAPYHGSGALDALVLDEFDRAAPRGTGSGKLGGNYAPVWPHQAKAKQSGFGMTLHLDSETRTLVEEFSTSGFVGVKGRAVHVPDTPNAVHSITSDSLTTLASREGWDVVSEKIPFSSLGQFSGVYAVGTAAVSVPIRSISRPSEGEGKKFSFEGSSEAAALIQKLSDIQRGLEADDFGWCWAVHEA